MLFEKIKRAYKNKGAINKTKPLYKIRFFVANLALKFQKVLL
jgi:hypothetical protein